VHTMTSTLSNSCEADLPCRLKVGYGWYLPWWRERSFVGEEGTIVCLDSGGFSDMARRDNTAGYPLKYSKTEEQEGAKARQPREFGKPVLAEVHEAISVR
jgi:hypothetical protein